MTHHFFDMFKNKKYISGFIFFSIFVASFLIIPRGTVFAADCEIDVVSQCMDNDVIDTDCPEFGAKSTAFSCPSGQQCCVQANDDGTIPSGSPQGATTPSTGMQYKLLEQFPGIAVEDGSNLPKYITAVYNLALVVIVLCALFMLSVGGFMYLTSAGNTSAMGTAKEVIFDSLIGLVIALVAWVFLNTINPDLVNVSIGGLSAVPVGAPPTGPAPAPGTGGTGTCGGFSPQSGINCGDAAQGLSDLLACIKGKGITTTVSSIGDSAGFNTCKNSWSKPPCAHAETSCHYGGGKTKTAPECQQSHAADLSVRNVSGGIDVPLTNAIKSAASACGARVNDETNIPGVAPHIHVSDQTSCCSL